MLAKEKKDAITYHIVKQIGTISGNKVSFQEDTSNIDIFMDINFSAPITGTYLHQQIGSGFWHTETLVNKGKLVHNIAPRQYDIRNYGFSNSYNSWDISPHNISSGYAYTYIPGTVPANNIGLFGRVETVAGVGSIVNFIFLGMVNGMRTWGKDELSNTITTGTIAPANAIGYLTIPGPKGKKYKIRVYGE